jgi:putative hydrolase
MGPFGFGGFGGFDLTEMMKFLQVEGPIHWDVARQTARWVSLEGDVEPPLDQHEKNRLTEIWAAAEARVLAETGEATPGGAAEAVGVAEFADRLLIGLQPVLERLAATMQTGAAEPLPAEMAANPLAGMMGAIGPVLFGVQCGFMIGQIARGLLSAHDEILPIKAIPRPTFVVPNVAAFHEAWSIPPDDLRFYIALQEAVRTRVMAHLWIRERLVGLALDYVGSFQVDPRALEEQLGNIDISDPSSFEQILSNPDAILGAMQSPQQLAVLEEMQTTTALLETYADSVVERIGGPLLPSLGLITEAARRAQVERSEADRFIARLLGLDPNRKAHGVAAAFCAGVVERAGSSGLDRLVDRQENLPTRNEIEAPGLWLARLDLPT